MKAIILAAGKGTRLRPLTNKIPKCLVPVNDKPIIENTLEGLEKVAVDECIIVVGYMAPVLRHEIKSRFKGKMKISFIENSEFASTNTSYSLKLALDELDIRDHENVFLIEGDVLFEHDLLTNFLNTKKTNCSLIQKYNPLLDGSFVEINENKLITDWIHTSRRLPSFTKDEKYKTINIHFFSGGFISNTLNPYLDQVIQMYSKKSPLEYVMQEIVTKQIPSPVEGYEIENDRWVEIDDLQDLEIAKKVFSS